ncbi:MFS transporter [[Bacillus] enclensis]|uniref:Transmembrane secretion effector n=1 Tax=[Bacillus] enclensis TaxID=1402860 RepID=A0A0V8HK12_9BACI|nr:MFS transporter [[Bacillus] enclensis]KSU62754.1 MFS transporter [[Bacillus] enclensis]SCC09012.1 Transmembrane secretion effector [[Bacillus] enclensis]
MKELLFHNRNFAWLFFGRLVTNMGDSIYYVAAMWLVYEMGGNAFYTGLAGFLTLLPGTLQFLIGPLVDRWKIKKVLILTQIIQALLVLMIPIAHYMGFLTVVFILVIMPIISAINQFVYPGQAALLPRIVRKDQLVKGNSLFSFAFQGVDLAFNAIAGILLTMIGAITLYLIDAVTFIAACILFSLLNIPEKESVKEKQKIKQTIHQYKTDLIEGFSIVFRSHLAKFLLGSIVANFAIGSVYAILPAFADGRAGSGLYGLYLAAISGGALIGALSASWLGRFPVGKLTILSFMIGGTMWLSSGFISSNSISILLFGISWIPIGATNVIFGSAIQSMVPSRLLGRIFSVTASLGAVAMPLGSLLGGLLASQFGPEAVYISSSGGILFIALVWTINKTLRSLPETSKLKPGEMGLPEGDPAVSGEVISG